MTIHNMKKWWMLRALNQGGELYPDNDTLYDAVYNELDIELSEKRLERLYDAIIIEIERLKQKYN